MIALLAERLVSCSAALHTGVNARCKVYLHLGARIDY